MFLGEANCCVFSADDMEAVPVKQFIKNVSKHHSSSQRGFSEDFEVNPLCHLCIATMGSIAIWASCC